MGISITFDLRVPGVHRADSVVSFARSLASWSRGEGECIYLATEKALNVRGFLGLGGPVAPVT